LTHSWAAVVALKQRKRFVGIELNPAYMELAMKRLRLLLEQKILVSDACPLRPAKKR